MDELTTRVSGLLDYGTVDLGYHYPVNSGSIRTLWGRIATTPPAGILPAHPRFWLLIRQQTSPAVERTAAINIGLRTAGGPYYPNWRTGTATITPDVDTLEIWNMVLPDSWSMVGENQLLLRLVDITPPPYNLPPYQPSGGTAIDTFIFTGIESGE
jgi:hypothetical protein